MILLQLHAATKASHQSLTIQQSLNSLSLRGVALALDRLAVWQARHPAFEFGEHLGLNRAHHGHSATAVQENRENRGQVPIKKIGVRFQLNSGDAAKRLKAHLNYNKFIK